MHAELLHAQLLFCPLHAYAIMFCCFVHVLHAFTGDCRLFDQVYCPSTLQTVSYTVYCQEAVVTKQQDGCCHGDWFRLPPW